MPVSEKETVRESDREGERGSEGERECRWKPVLDTSEVRFTVRWYIQFCFHSTTGKIRTKIPGAQREGAHSYCNSANI